MMRKIAFVLCTLVLFCGSLWAQSRIVSGKVVDDKGNPVEGASIQIKGSRRGTSTTTDGVFSISAPSASRILVVSSLNFTTQEVPISENLTFVLKAIPINNLQEVVVVAYGIQKKTEITGAVSVVQAETIKNQQVVSIGQALQGTAPGVQVVNTNGQPGQNPVIRIRGTASIAASPDPLIVLDGIPYDGNLNMINPTDIDNFSILKDASATALYGSRGANGVILINTKTGKKNAPPSISLSAVYGLSSRANADYPYLDTRQQFELGWEGMKNNYAASNNPATSSQAAKLATQNLIKSGFHYNPYSALANPVDTNGKLLPGASLLWNDNWTKALERSQASRKDINIGIGGGTDRSRYYFSAGLLNQDGYLVKSNYQRVSTTFNYNTDLTDWFQIGAKTNIISSKQNYPAQGTGTFSDLVNYGRTVSSVFPIYARDENGQLLKDQNGQLVFDYGNPVPNRTVNVRRPVLQPSNVVGTVNLDNWNYDRLLVNLNTFGQINFTKNLFYKSSFGINRSLEDQSQFGNKDYGDAASVGGRIYREQDLVTSWTWNNMVGYDHRWGEHHFEAMASYESYRYNYESLSGSKTGFGFNGQQQWSNASTSELQEGFTVTSTLVSYLGRVKYDYANKYFAEFTIRRDGSSIFAPGRRYGTFPAGGVSWLLSREKFLKTATFINLLKLRGSYGVTGNNALLDPTDPLAFRRSYFPYINTFASGYNDLANVGVYLNQLANYNIRWEKNLSTNIGIDFELFDRRLNGSVDLFRKSSRDLIQFQPLPPSSGFGTIVSNISKMQNQGVEINLNYIVLRSRDFHWDVNLNLTWLQNKIINLLPDQNTFASKGAFRNVGGKSIYEFYLPVWAGVNPETGHGRWWMNEKDGNGQPTGKQRMTDTFALADGKWVGSGIPKYTGGFSTRLKYKAFDLTLLFNYAFGGKYYDGNYAKLMHGFYGGYGAQLHTDELQRWQKKGDLTDVPKLNPAGNDEQQLSTRFLFSGDYIRLRNITLGYTVVPGSAQKIVKTLRIFIQADNCFTWDQLKKGSDPESSVNGYANGNAFPFKTFSTGLDLNF
ncbi:SusC/RagA family TonB-linked outer membrane protein [Flavitalea flava]